MNETRTQKNRSNCLCGNHLYVVEMQTLQDACVCLGSEFHKNAPNDVGDIDI
jgi:hypothetical protein